MKVTVVTRSGKELFKGGLELSDSATVADLQEEIHKRSKKFYPSRQRLTLPVQPGSKEKAVVLTSKKSLKDYYSGNSNNLTVVFKDLGPQVEYRTLFFFENCAYYWSFAALMSYYVNHPLYTPVSDLQMKIGFGFGIINQIANFYCHILLRNLRSPDGSGGYQIPRGFLFNIVTCANYTTEIYQWLGFNIATQTVAGYLFAVVAASIMTNWALVKHRRLKKLFDGKDGRPKYPRRWVILPPFL
ncbi:hypothetical protein ACLB2K_076228 [Fragaria x ananassa]